MTRSVTLALVFASVPMLIATAAGAEERRAASSSEPLVFGSGASYEVAFDDDPLAALPNGVIVPRLRVRPTVASPQLMRARTQFVLEISKSTEVL